MATLFDERDNAYEAKFAHDAEKAFRALARRDKLFALWSVGRLRLTGPARDAFIHDLLAIEGFPRHDEALLRFVADRFAEAGLDPAETPRALDRLGAEATEQVQRGNAPPIDLTAPPTP